MKLTLWIDTPPQGRPRFTRSGIAYDPPKSRQFKSATTPKFGDIDNLAKIILDAINETGAVWKDDRFITELTVLKATAPEPRVEIWIEEEI